MEDNGRVSELVDGMPEVIRHENLAEAWSQLADRLGLDSSQGMSIIVAAPRDLTLRQAQRGDSAWGGAWEWNLSDAATRTTLVGVLITAAMMAAGAGTGLAPVLIPAVLPLLFDLKRVRLERTADHYLSIIGSRNEVAQRCGTMEELYDSLPETVKTEVSKRELAEFLGQATDAGKARLKDGVFEVLSSGETAFKIQIR